MSTCAASRRVSELPHGIVARSGVAPRVRTLCMAERLTVSLSNPETTLSSLAPMGVIPKFTPTSHACIPCRNHIIGSCGGQRVSPVLQKAAPTGASLETIASATSVSPVPRSTDPDPASLETVDRLAASNQRLEERVAALQIDVRRILEHLSDPRGHSSRELET